MSTVFIVYGEFSVSTVFLIFGEFCVSTVFLIFGEFCMSAVLLVFGEYCQECIRESTQQHTQSIAQRTKILCVCCCTRNTVDAENSPNTRNIFDAKTATYNIIN